MRKQPKRRDETLADAAETPAAATPDNPLQNVYASIARAMQRPRRPRLVEPQGPRGIRPSAVTAREIPPSAANRPTRPVAFRPNVEAGDAPELATPASRAPCLRLSEQRRAFAAAQAERKRANAEAFATAGRQMTARVGLRRA